MKKLLGFLAVMITALFVLGACKQAKSTPSPETKTITIKVGLSDGTKAILAPVPISFSADEGEDITAKIQKELGLKMVNDKLTYTKDNKTYTVESLLKPYTDVECTKEFKDKDPADGTVVYLKVTEK